MLRVHDALVDAATDRRWGDGVVSGAIPLDAWKALLAGEAEPTPRSSMDYADADQVARQVLIDGEPWVVLLRRGA